MTPVSDCFSLGGGSKVLDLGHVPWKQLSVHAAAVDLLWMIIPMETDKREVISAAGWGMTTHK